MNTKSIVTKLEATENESQLRDYINSLRYNVNDNLVIIGRHLSDVFWYIDLKTFENKKKFALKIAKSYK